MKNLTDLQYRIALSASFLILFIFLKIAYDITFVSATAVSLLISLFVVSIINAIMVNLP